MRDKITKTKQSVAQATAEKSEIVKSIQTLQQQIKQPAAQTDETLHGMFFQYLKKWQNQYTIH